MPDSKSVYLYFSKTSECLVLYCMVMMCELHGDDV